MTTLAPSPWLRRLAERPYAEIDLYCFPHGGGGPSVFGGWSDHLPPFIEPYALALPGREHRLGEPAATAADSVIEEVLDVLRMSSRPYALFGHSSGSAFATQVALALQREGAPAPVLLGVSAFPAPHLATRCAAVREMFQADLEGTVLRLDRHAAAAFDDPAVKAQALAAVGADVVLHSSYRMPVAGVLDCPISTFCGEQDPVVDPVELREWASLTLGGLTAHRYPGGHFYLREQRATIVADLVWDLSAAWRLLRPEVSDLQAVGFEEAAQDGQGQPDDVARVAVDAFDEPGTEAVDREGSGDREGLAGGDIGADLCFRRRAEADGRAGDLDGLLSGDGVDHAVTGVEHARAAATGLPPPDRLLGVDGLALSLAVDLEQRVAADDQGVLRGRRDGGGLGPGQGDDQPGHRRLGDRVLVHSADDDLGGEARLLQDLQPRR